MSRVPTPTILPGGFSEDGRSTDIITPYDTSIPSLQPSRWLQPTPTSNIPAPNTHTPIAFSGYGSGDDDYTHSEPTQGATFPRPVSSSTTTVRPPDVIIRLRLDFEPDITAEQRTQVGQNLSNAVKEILQLSISPLVSQDSDDVFTLLIVTSSSSLDNITGEDVDGIRTVLLTGKLSSRLQGVAVSVELLTMLK